MSVEMLKGVLYALFGMGGIGLIVAGIYGAINAYRENYDKSMIALIGGGYTLGGVGLIMMSVWNLRQYVLLGIITCVAIAAVIATILVSIAKRWKSTEESDQ